MHGTVSPCIGSRDAPCRANFVGHRVGISPAPCPRPYGAGTVWAGSRFRASCIRCHRDVPRLSVPWADRLSPCVPIATLCDPWAVRFHRVVVPLATPGSEALREGLKLRVIAREKCGACPLPITTQVTVVDYSECDVVIQASLFQCRSSGFCHGCPLPFLFRVSLWHRRGETGSNSQGAGFVYGSSLQFFPEPSFPHT